MTVLKFDLKIYKDGDIIGIPYVISHTGDMKIIVDSIVVALRKATTLAVDAFGDLLK